jgi:Phage head-tail joining protein
MIYHQEVSILRAPLVAGDYGNQDRDWQNAASTTSPAEIQPIKAGEAVVNEQRTITRWRVFLPASSNLVSTDRVSWAGATYEVDGEVEQWTRRRRLHHLEAVLQRVRQDAG